MTKHINSSYVIGMIISELFDTLIDEDETCYETFSCINKEIRACVLQHPWTPQLLLMKQRWRKNHYTMPVRLMSWDGTKALALAGPTFEKGLTRNRVALTDKTTKCKWIIWQSGQFQIDDSRFGRLFMDLCGKSGPGGQIIGWSSNQDWNQEWRLKRSGHIQNAKGLVVEYSPEEGITAQAFKRFCPNQQFYIDSTVDE
eukprot:TRINITY_DN4852_c0_g1_i1.p1 TRINITY_DN4852_c0_g1~~TRINITY_DN4852_c0_g1_i1.p1  ORF type:complete len:199 (-),score=28.39 TRINITY_DN4852_c0_g1_i1:45-641(-)